MLESQRIHCCQKGEYNRLGRKSVGIRMIEHSGPSGLRVGVDVVLQGRIRLALKRHDPEFSANLFRQTELEAFSDPRSKASPEKSFTAKEALLKSLRIGVTNGVSLRNIEAIHPEDRIVVHGILCMLLDRLQKYTIEANTWKTACHQISVVWLC